MKAFYVLILGKVRLYNLEKAGRKIYKVCQPGETIGEEILFTNAHRKVALESARAVTKGFLLEVKLDRFQRIFE